MLVRVAFLNLIGHELSPGFLNASISKVGCGRCAETAAAAGPTAISTPPAQAHQFRRKSRQPRGAPLRSDTLAGFSYLQLCIPQHFFSQRRVSPPHVAAPRPAFLTGPVIPYGAPRAPCIRQTLEGLARLPHEVSHE